MTEQILSRFVEGPKEPGKLLLPTLTDQGIEGLPLIGEGLGFSEIGLRLHLSTRLIVWRAKGHSENNRYFIQGIECS